MKESRMYEGLTAMLTYCVEMEDKENEQILRFYMKRFMTSDEYQQRQIYDSARVIMRSYHVPRRPSCPIDELFEEIKPVVFAAAKLQFDCIGEFMLSHKRAGFKKYTLAEYQENQYNTMRLKIRDLVRQEFFTLDRDENGKVVLTDIREDDIPRKEMKFTPNQEEE